MVDVFDRIWNSLTQNTKRKTLSESLTFSTAAANGHTDVLKYLWYLAGSLDVQHAMLEAYDYYAFTLATMGGHTGALKYLWNLADLPNARREMLEADDYEVFGTASIRGNTKVLDLLLEKAWSLGV
ncbi:MAG: hypothetical protein ACR5LB_11545 [Wolbachia sp.]